MSRKNPGSGVKFWTWLSGVCIAICIALFAVGCGAVQSSSSEDPDTGTDNRTNLINEVQFELTDHNTVTCLVYQPGGISCDWQRAS